MENLLCHLNITELETAKERGAVRINVLFNVTHQQYEKLSSAISAKYKEHRKKPDGSKADLIKDVLLLCETPEEVNAAIFNIGVLLEREEYCCVAPGLYIKHS